VRQPEALAGLGPAMHAGASNYFDKDKPTFLQANADFLGLMLTVTLMIGSWIWQIKQWIGRQQKNAADLYSDRAVILMSAAEKAVSVAELDQLRHALLGALTEAVRDLDADKLSEESFHSCRSILQIAMEVTRERRASLVGMAAAATS
jgi:uncharacterized protein